MPIVKQPVEVDLATKGIANVVTWLYRAKDEAPPVIHSDDQARQKLGVSLEFKDFTLQPRVTTLQKNQQLIVRNQDSVRHVLSGNLFANGKFDVMVPAAGGDSTEFRKHESRPMPLSDPMFPWIEGWIVITDHPFVAVSDKQGKMKIDNLPVGRHTFVFWHESVGFLKTLERDDKIETLKLGRITVDIKSGDNDLGTIYCTPDKK
ncbi:hypothetical protein [Anatilimnocola floriformis]|uniref:hypothetical protein n=1 Tax=Anatilimnocola floriformis TaxID=2948575 RepID=UPI0020C4C251|nr:hypothetical protein [Anatilimnocola floriformis]